VKLQRAFGFGKTAEFDPFLLLDDFRSDKPADYVAGFRGIRTGDRDDYLCAGRRGGAWRQPGQPGEDGRGDVQWMTAGSGILHQEMPSGDAQGDAWLSALGQLASSAEDDRAALSGHCCQRDSRGDGGRREPGAGDLRRVLGQDGAGGGVATESSIAARYVDISVPPGKRKRIRVETTRHAFAYVFAGAGTFRDASEPRAC